MQTHKKRILAALLLFLLAMTLARPSSATLPPMDPSDGPWACYRIIWPDRWYFIGMFWEDQTSPWWTFDRVVCFYRY